MIEAEKYYLMAIEKDPNPKYLCNLATCYYRQEKYDQAEKYFLFATKKNPNPKYLNCCAIFYCNQKKYIEAEKYYLMVIEKDPKSKYLYNLATCYYRQEKYDQAEKYFLFATKKNPNPKYLNYCAIFYHNQKKFDEAEKYLLLIMEKDSDPRYLENLVTIYDNQKKYNELLILHKKYDIRIDHIILDILRTNFQLNEISLGILRHYDTSNNNIFSEQDLYIHNIVKKIGVVPITNSVEQCESYKLFMNPNFHKQIQLRIKRLIPKNIFICICRKIFGNDS